MDDERPLWERQPWDTGASYKAFKDYFLPAAEPGALINAYRAYRRDNRRESGANQARRKKIDDSQITAVPGSWSNWSRARNSKGEPIPGAVTWEQRKAAFEAHLAGKELAKLAERKAKSKEARLRVAEGALAQLTIIWSQLDFRPKRGPDGQLIVPDLPPFKDAVRALDVILNQLRIEHDDLPQQRMELSGKDGSPVITQLERPSYSHLSDEELLDRLAELDAKRAGRVPGSE